jgi:hypothetical protein
MIEELVRMVFETRNQAHLQHWRESSGFSHETLGTFYDDLIDNIDDIVEAHQGLFDLVNVEDDSAGIESKIKDDLLFISKSRKEITKGIPAIDNLLQNLEHTYMKTLYKLTRLK